MRRIRLLALIPFLGLLGGAFVANRVKPYVAGLPFFMFWVVLWVLLSSLIMAIIYLADPANRQGPPE